MALAKLLDEYGLSKRWLSILNDQLGIKTKQGLKYASGIEMYLQFAKDAQEKSALQTFLLSNDLTTFSSLRVEQMKTLHEKQQDMKILVN